MTAAPTGRVCTATGFHLAAARRTSAWRVAKDRYVAAGGINNVLVNDRIGPLPLRAPDVRGRFDTVGRTVYFADTPRTALAETLQAFRVKVVSLSKDATAIGLNVADYRRQLTEEAHARGLAGPGEVDVDWQIARSLYKVDLPGDGWWVVIDRSDTLNALTDALGGAAGPLTLADVSGNERSLTTQLAQIVREAVLDDGSLPVGIEFPSKTGYGRCWAWWNRRADDNLTPGVNDPQLTGSITVAGPELDEIRNDWDLTMVGH